MNRRSRSARTITIQTIRKGGHRHDFIADIRGTMQTDGTIVGGNGIRWKV